VKTFVRTTGRMLAMAGLGLAAAVPGGAGQDTTATLRGAVVDSTTGTLLPEVLLVVEGSGIEALTDHTGTFRLPPLGLGRYRLTFLREGYRTRSFEFNITPAFLRTIDIGVVPLIPIPHYRITLRGTAMDVNTGNPLRGVSIVLSTGEGTETARDGTFTITNIDAAEGTQPLYARRVGYESVTLPIRVQKDRTEFTLDLRMNPLPVRLDDIRVEGHMAPKRLADFFRRRAQGEGHFLAPWEIDQIPASDVTDILREIPGVFLTPGAFNSSVLLGRGCDRQPRLIVDGLELRNYGSLTAVVSHTDVSAVEVYNGASNIPPQFQRALGNGCGLIVIWTK